MNFSIEEVALSRPMPVRWTCSFMLKTSSSTAANNAIFIFLSLFGDFFAAKIRKSPIPFPYNIFGFRALWPSKNL